MPSGIFTTNFLDSILNLTALLTVFSELGFTVTDPRKFFIRVMGDDSLTLVCQTMETLGCLDFTSRFRESAARRFGFKTNEKKCDITRGLEGAPFLGYVSKRLYPTRSTTKLLAKLLYPERDSDMSKLKARCIGIAWASAGQDERVYHVCKDVYDYLSDIKPDPRALDFLEYIHEDITAINMLEFPTLTQIKDQLIPLTSSTSRSKMQGNHFIRSSSHYHEHKSQFQKLYPSVQYPADLYWLTIANTALHS